MPYSADPVAKSKRIFTSILALVVLISGTFGYHILPETQEALIQAVEYFALGMVILLPIWSKISEKIKIKKEAETVNEYREKIDRGTQHVDYNSSDSKPGA
jgi:hypothetical protein